MKRSQLCTFLFMSLGFSFISGFCIKMVVLGEHAIYEFLGSVLLAL